MKKIALFMAMAVVAVACETQEQITPEVKVLTDEATLVIPTEGGSAVIDFDSNVEWTAAFKEAADWCSLSPKSGVAGAGKLTVQAIENAGNDNRSVVVVITAESATAEVTVSQLQKDALVAGQTSYDVPAEGGEVKVKLGHNVDYDVAIDADWLTQTKAYTEAELVFTAAANTNLEGRTAKITITAGNLKQEITVNQAAFVPTFEMDVTELWIASEGGDAVLNITANFEYSVAVAEGCDWLTVTSEGGKHTFTAVANPGFGYRAVEIVISGWTKEDDENTPDVNEAQKFYVFQNGRAEVKWQKTVNTDWNWELANTSFRFVVKDNMMLLANGTNVIKVVDKATGAFLMDYTLPEGMVVNTLALDDAGNIVACADAPYNTDGAKTQVYYMTEISATATPQLLGEITNKNIYSTAAGNFRIKGDVTKKAVMVGFASLSQFFLAFNIVDGVISNEQFGALPESDKTIWGPNNAVLYPLGDEVADGFIYTGYTTTLDVYKLDMSIIADWGKWKADGTSILTGYFNGNDIPNSIDIKVVDGKTYMVIGIGAIFTWTSARAVVFDITDMSNIVEVGTWYVPDASSTAVLHPDQTNYPNYTKHGQGSDVALEDTDAGFIIYHASAGNQRVSCVEVK